MNMFSFLLGTDLGEELLGHKVTLCLTFLKMTRLMAKAAVSPSVPSDSV